MLDLRALISFLMQTGHGLKRGSRSQRCTVQAPDSPFMISALELTDRGSTMTQEAYGQAYGKGFGATVGLLRSRGASADTAEDVAQAAWLRGWQKREQLRDDRLVVSWVNTIALNYHRRGIKNEARYQPLLELSGRVGIDLAPIETTKILQSCRPLDRTLFEQQLSGLTTKEIANKQGVSETAIRIRFSRARRAVRASVEGRGIDRARASV
jgi:DNA-directed RNA polymerase specialized sigma24 family protein